MEYTIRQSDYSLKAAPLTSWLDAAIATPAYKENALFILP